MLEYLSMRKGVLAHGRMSIHYTLPRELRSLEIPPGTPCACCRKMLESHRQDNAKFCLRRSCRNIRARMWREAQRQKNGHVPKQHKVTPEIHTFMCEARQQGHTIKQIRSHVQERFGILLSGVTIHVHTTRYQGCDL